MLQSLLLKLYLKTNGWKSVMGYVLARISEMVQGYDPSFPAPALVEVLRYMGEGLLAYGLLDKARKTVTGK